MISTATSKVGGAMRSMTVFWPRRRFASSSLSVTLHRLEALLITPQHFHGHLQPSSKVKASTPHQGAVDHCCEGHGEGQLASVREEGLSWEDLTRIAVMPYSTWYTEHDILP